MSPMQLRVQRRIMTSISEDASTGCWEWRRQISNSGYGRIMLGGPDGTRSESAHRASYAAFVRPPAADEIVRHTCGNRLCVNPEHLEAVPASMD